MRNAEAILSVKSKSLTSIEPSVYVYDALHLLNSVNLSYLVVMKDNEYQGIFCERDYSRNVILKGKSSKDTTVGEVMTRDLPLVHIGDSAEYCMNLMMTHSVRYLLVYDEPEFKGVLTIHDLLREVIRSQREHEDTSLSEELVTREAWL